MRITMLAGLGIALAGPATAQAQQGYGATYPVPGRSEATSSGIGTATPAADRWGSRVDGRWWGGANAPGGWPAYRAPYPGYALPRYWTAPRFAIGDWSSYALTPPPRGYRWSRYYDDAVLIDRNGSVRDSVSGLDWQGSRPGYGGAPARVRPGDYDRDYRDDRVFAGPDDRSHGRYVAADGVEGPRRADRAPPPPPPSGYEGYDGYGAPYDGPAYAYDAPLPPPPPPHYLPPESRYVTPDGTTIITTRVGAPGYYGGGSTVVTVESAPARTVTTTTTDYVDTTRRAAPRQVRARGRGTKIIRR